MAKRWLAILCFIFLPCAPLRAFADDVSVNGFLQANYSANTAEENPDAGDYKWSDERVRIKLNASKEPVDLLIKADALYDNIESNADVELREGYLNSSGESWDVRAGRQVITWGIGDLIFINDIFPKDHEAFYSGRPMEYLKKGVDGIKLGAYPGDASIDAVYVPFFTPDTFPRSDRFHSSANIKGEKPASTPKNAETALRAYGNAKGIDIAAYYYNGYYRMPAFDMMTGGYYYPELVAYGMSAEGRLVGGIAGMEAGYYDSKSDRRGEYPFVENSSTKLLIAYKRQILADFSIGLQYYTTYMRDYDDYEKYLPLDMPHADRRYQLASLRLTSLHMNQSLRLSMFAFYGISEGDYLLNPEVQYKFNDSVWASVGGNVFGGKKSGRFGMLDKNDNVYLQARYEF